MNFRGPQSQEAVERKASRNPCSTAQMASTDCYCAIQRIERHLCRLTFWPSSSLGDPPFSSPRCSCLTDFSDEACTIACRSLRQRQRGRCVSAYRSSDLRTPERHLNARLMATPERRCHRRGKTIGVTCITYTKTSLLSCVCCCDWR